MPYGAKERREFEARMADLVKKRDTHLDFTRDMVLKHASELESRYWGTIRAPLGREFVMSDAPAKAIQIALGATRVLDFQGLARPDVALFMPLSPLVGIIGAAERRMLLSQFDVNSLNGATIMGASQVYARTRELAELGHHTK